MIAKFFPIAVCLEIQLQIAGEIYNTTNITFDGSSEVRWTLGTCSSVNSKFENTEYQYGSSFVERCCLVPGKHTLTCDSIIPTRGWKGAYLPIDGVTYCDNFINYKLMQKIIVAGKNLVFLLLIVFNELHNWCSICLLIYILQIAQVIGYVSMDRNVIT